MNFIKTIPSSLTDSELMMAYRTDKDLNTLSILYDRYIELIFGLCLKYLKNEEDAKDAVINIYEELIAKVHKHEITYFRSWLYQVAKNHCLMILRKNKHYTVEFNPDFMQSPSDLHQGEAVLKESQLTIMEDCIQKLTDHQKTAVELFYLRGKCYKEVAEITNSEVNMVKSQIQNGRRNLKICMENNQHQINN